MENTPVAPKGFKKYFEAEIHETQKNFDNNNRVSLNPE